MRFWKDKNGSMLTDEQLLRHIAHFGSLSESLSQGDISLVAETSPSHIANVATEPSGKTSHQFKRLSYHLQESNSA